MMMLNGRGTYFTMSSQSASAAAWQSLYIVSLGIRQDRT